MSEGKVYNLLITRGIDPDNQYEFYKERIDSQRDFLYNEYNTIENELTEELFEKVDVVVLLFGLFNDNKELFKELIAKSKQYNVPLLLIRFFGMEYVLKELEEISDAVVGWNPHCIVDAIETLVDGEDWVKPCDISEEE
ncbi:MAG: nuclease [Methanobrevibacter sp.]|uniref:nuclease n=1 Tax=Methanobrevibacter TaxID=2172 RepID=UPI0026EABA08|nr:nuclease [Methanobrevibacter gottschalkii]MCI7429230.1 nuclease [Methanobrevibacter sp.]MDD6776191.1 nuclease [Methanobacteriaceae archaeon]